MSARAGVRETAMMHDGRPRGCKVRSMEDVSLLLAETRKLKRQVEGVHCHSESEGKEQDARSERRARRLAMGALMDVLGCERGGNRFNESIDSWVAQSEGATQSDWASEGASFDEPADVPSEGQDEDFDAYSELDLLRRARQGSIVSLVGEDCHLPVRLRSADLDHEPVWFEDLCEVDRKEDLPCGQGRMRSYRCLVSGREAVCKVVDSELGHVDVPETLASLASLRHPKLCTLIGAANEPNGVHVFTGTLSGGSLLDLLVSENRKAFTLGLSVFSSWTPKASRAVNWLGDVLQAMCYLHSHEVSFVHGNICLSNIVLSSDQRTAKLTDAVLNKNLHLNRALTPEHDIRSFGFAVWQLSTGKVIIRADEEPEFVRSASGGVKGLCVPEGSVQASAISKKGMRALFKACVHQQGSSHVPARTAEDLEGVFRRLQKIRVLPRRRRSMSLVNVPRLEALKDKEPDLSLHSYSGLESSSVLAQALANDIPRPCVADLRRRLPAIDAFVVDSDQIDPFRDLSQESIYSSTHSAQASSCDTPRSGASNEEPLRPKKANWASSMLSKSLKHIFRLPQPLSPSSDTGSDAINSGTREVSLAPLPRTGSAPP